MEIMSSLTVESESVRMCVYTIRLYSACDFSISAPVCLLSVHLADPLLILQHVKWWETQKSVGFILLLNAEWQER